MDLHRRTLLAAAAGAGTLASLAGCAATAGGSVDVDTSGPVEGEITFLTAIFEGSSGKELLEGTLLPRFTAQHPDVTVVVDYTSYASLNEKITTGLASGFMPDVLTLGVGWVEPFAYKKAVARLPETLATRYDYLGRVLEPSRFDGDLFALPLVLDTRIGVYRKDLLADAGFDGPPEDWAQLREMAKALTVRGGDGRTSRVGFDPFSIDLRQCWETLLFGHGGELFSADGKSVRFDEPAGVESLQLLVDMQDDGSADYAFKTAAGAPSTVEAGTAAMMMANSTIYTTMQQQSPRLLADDLVGTFVIGDTAPAMLQGGTLVAQSTTSKHPAAARALLEFLGSPEVILPACEQRGSVPGVAELADSDYVRSNPFTGFALSNLDDARSEGGSPAWMGIREKVKPTLETAVLGQQSAHDAIAQLARDARAAIARL